MTLPYMITLGPIIFFLQARFFFSKDMTLPEAPIWRKKLQIRCWEKEEMSYVYFFFLILLTATTANKPASAIIPTGVNAGTFALGFPIPP